jgi:serine/threonine-protein kinase
MFVAAALALATLAPPARADDRAAAQQLFQQAKELMAKGNTAEACKKFEAAAQLSQTAGVRLNLSDCYDKIGRTASAWAKADEALALAERTGDDAAAELAKQRLTSLKPKLSYLTVSVPNEASVTGLEIQRDGERLPQATWGTSMPVDPGEHEIRASAPGRRPWSTKQSVAGAAANETVTVPALEEEKASGVGGGTAGAAPAPSADGTSPVADTGESPGSTQRTLGLVMGGAGVVGIAVGAVFGVRMLSKKSQYKEHQAPDGHCLDMDCQTLSEEARSAGNVATVGWIAGGVLAATGTVLYLTAPKKETGARVGVAATVGPWQTGLHVTGSW